MTRLAAIWLLSLAALASQAWAQAQGRLEASEAGIKAAFLYKFASYVEWPPAAFPDAGSPFVFGIAGNDEVAAELERLVAGKTIQGHPTAVRRIKEGEGLNGVPVLFVGRGQSNPRALIRAAQSGTLVVTESPGALDLGSAINFIPVEDRVGFEVSVDAAERNGLKISSRMLNVARRVVQR